MIKLIASLGVTVIIIGTIIVFYILGLIVGVPIVIVGCLIVFFGWAGKKLGKRTRGNDG